MFDWTFAYKGFLFLLLLIPVVIFWLWRGREKHYATFRLPDTTGIETKSFSNWKVRSYPLKNVLKVLALTSIILALARPQSALSESEVTTEGIDIVLSLDISGSMLARDFLPDRLEAAKEIAISFIDERPNDRIGLVVFSGESFTQCPITTDHKVLKNLFKSVKSGIIEDGTAIGMGLATSVNRLTESEAKSKVIILMTDGVNNTGYVDPITAIELAKSEGIRVYTIGIGTRGMAPYPVRDVFGRTVYQDMQVEIDEELLVKISAETGGNYWRATNENKLKEIFTEIDKLEKSKVSVSSFERKKEHFYLFAWIALAALALEIMLSHTYWRSIS